MTRKLLESRDRPADETIYLGPDDMEVRASDHLPLSSSELQQMVAFEQLRQRRYMHVWGPILAGGIILGVIAVVVMTIGLPFLVELAELKVEERTAELAIAQANSTSSKWGEEQILLMLGTVVALVFILRKFK